MKKVIILICISLLIPYIVTLIFVNREKLNYKTYEIKESGKNIILSEGTLDMEKFVPLVLMTRMDIEEEEEVLKVQSILIRTYIAGKLKEAKSNSIKIEDLKLKYVTYSELEKKWGNNFSKNYNYLNKIICNTEMEIIIYKDEIIIPYFHEASYGKTRAGKYEYLKSVASEKDTSAKNFLTIKYIQKKEFENVLRDYDLSKEIVYNKAEDSEYVESVKIGDDTIKGNEFAKMFELPSPAFVVEAFNGEIRIISKGKGHGYGLSMAGACEMAKDGADYKKIINYYYSDVTIDKYK